MATHGLLTSSNVSQSGVPASKMITPAKLRVLRLVKGGIWIYILLWLIEGGLRRWLLPGLASPLLVVRDPLLLWIYYIAFQGGIFPRNTLVYLAGVLAAISWGLAVTSGHGNAFVATYGVRCDFLHLPLIFIIGNAFEPADLNKLAKIAICLAIPYTLLLIAQFYSPQSAWINRGVGGDLAGAGFSGALGKFRPPGTFSFITGVSQLYPMLAGAWFFLLFRGRFGVLLLALSGLSILLAIPFSISRSLFIGEAIVGAAGAYSMIVGGYISTRLAAQLFGGAILATCVFVALPGTEDALEAFSTRWERSTTARGGVEEAIVGRVWISLSRPFSSANVVGYGTGISTQVGQKLATGTRGFGYSEGEWGRILAEGGLVFGSLIIWHRMWLLAFITRRCIQGFRKGQHQSLPLLAACAPMLLIGQFGQATSLGSAVISSGLCLAATKFNASNLQ